MHLFVDNLTNVDFSYLHAERGLLGETWLAHVQLDGALDHQGMVCDFGVVKKTLRQWLDTELDHRLAIPVHSPNLSLTEEGDSLDIRWRYGQDRELHCRSPRQAIALVEAESLTSETVAQWCIAKLTPLFPDSIDQLTLSFTPENIDGNYYHYSHGLKKHAGNCQRIAHGHRSRITIWKDGQRAEALEAQWASRWEDIYIGTREDVISDDDGKYQFAYRTSQGEFALSLPSSCCYLIDTDSTVEFIANHIAGELKKDHPHSHIRVRAFEGIGKGAMVEL